jgi:hypothetical protein
MGMNKKKITTSIRVNQGYPNMKMDSLNKENGYWTCQKEGSSSKLIIRVKSKIPLKLDVSQSNITLSGNVHPEVEPGDIEVPSEGKFNINGYEGNRTEEILEIGPTAGPKWNIDLSKLLE